MLADDAMACTSELVTNAIRHAAWPVGGLNRRVVTVVMQRAPDWVVCEVLDLDERVPDFGAVASGRGPDAELAEVGRGLRIVARIADDFGSRRLAVGKSVWFLLRTTVHLDGSA
jgi:anti-sigma regulatory factor (Ser/Thr protein kinase)